MNAIKFDSPVEAGMIRIPEQYRNAVGNMVKVIIFPLDETKPILSVEKRMEKVRALTGIIPDDFDLDEVRTERILGKQSRT
ncbi:MAG: hypothetical protein LBO68_03265 [Synergistaceae bacterium]|nr:hypothetical protein [Synergistaceae bacterium]